MNGDDHYAEAERLVNKSSGGGDWAPDNCSILIAAAQVHATLALASYTADLAGDAASTYTYITRGYY
jgi:hypothetical protein